MNYYDIILEVTRKCNLKCSHCMRGPAQNKTVSDWVLNALGKEKICSLFLTGGEPTLSGDIFQRLIRYRVIPDMSIGVVTNGKVFRKQWAENFFSFAIDFKLTDSYFLVSTDEFHPYNIDVFHKYSELAYMSGFYNDVSKHNDGMTYNELLLEGNACYDGSVNLEENQSDWDTEEPHERRIYITVDGDVLFGCNWSYKRMKYLKVGNITERSLDSIIDAAKDYKKKYKKISKICYSKLN